MEKYYKVESSPQQLSESGINMRLGDYLKSQNINVWGGYGNSDLTVSFCIDIENINMKGISKVKELMSFEVEALKKKPVYFL